MISLFVSAAKKDWQIKGRNGYDENEGSFRTQRLNLGRAVVEKSSALLCHYVKKEGRKEGRKEGPFRASISAAAEGMLLLSHFIAAVEVSVQCS